MTKFIQIITTVGEKEQAEKIAEKLINEKLAGCVQILGPIKSIYRWNNNVEKNKEWLCLIKTKKDLYEKLENSIKEIHPYDIPEIIYSPISEGNKEYLEWLEEEVSP